jgi:hypothetical protein
VTDYFKDKTPLWSPEQIKELESEWNPKDSKIIAEELSPQDYQEIIQKYPKRHSCLTDPMDWTLIEFVHFLRIDKYGLQSKMKREGRWCAEYGPTVWDPKMPPGFATPWEKDL